MKKPLVKKTSNFNSVLLGAFGTWEVRLTPMNKVFVLNTATDQPLWPYLDKKGSIKFQAIHSVKQALPPQEAQDVAERVLKKQRTVRSAHHDDYVETEDQYTFN